MKKDNKEYLFKLRHSAEHVLTQAMVNLYGRDKIIMAMGPATEEGFYFDFETKDIKVSEENFSKIEKEMYKIVNKGFDITRHEIEISDARELFKDNSYKQEWLDEIEAAGEKATVYWTGEPNAEGSFVDLCKGPHIDNTKEIGAIKLLSVAGAYWRGDEKNQMLTRIYGTAFESREELKAYLHMLEEAKKRDHKKLGKELDLFTFSNLVGAGLPLWTPKGTLIRNILEDYVWQLRSAKGYQKVTIPHITKKDLYETSGHWAKYEDDLFKIETREGHTFAMKPMNCPHHTQIYDHVPRSYKDLPQRYSETTMVYRDEQSGELSGLSRVRCITQDDAHVFCRESQLEDEMLAIWDIIETFYKDTGFPKLEVRLSLHDPEKMENYLGEEEDWQRWEDGLRNLAKKRGVEFVEQKGEAAFYGPKIDFIAYDSIGREWQVATIQADRNMPKSFDLNCANEENEVERIVMVHAAIMGSIERFMSILIEHHAGAFPVWISPVQAVVLPISDRHLEYAKEVAAQALELGLRVEVVDTNESLSKKIRNAQKGKIPYSLVVGDEEVEKKTVAVRRRGEREQEVVSVDEFLAKLVKQDQDKS
ncbi:MAG: threonine--tRNA ligase [Candidatus Pacebacteria bacterium]|nr:threonine--tRNA ligase [Candidatus Paceibacterota bacterium]